MYTNVGAIYSPKNQHFTQGKLQFAPTKYPKGIVN